MKQNKQIKIKIKIKQKIGLWVYEFDAFLFSMFLETFGNGQYIAWKNNVWPLSTAKEGWDNQTINIQR